MVGLMGSACPLYFDLGPVPAVAGSEDEPWGDWTAPPAKATGGLRRRRSLARSGNADGNNHNGKRGWQLAMVTAVVAVFVQGLSRSTAAAIELPATAFGGIVVSDRCTRGGLPFGLIDAA